MSEQGIIIIKENVLADNEYNNILTYDEEQGSIFKSKEIYEESFLKNNLIITKSNKVNYSYKEMIQVQYWVLKRLNSNI